MSILLYDYYLDKFNPKSVSNEDWKQIFLYNKEAFAEQIPDEPIPSEDQIKKSFTHQNHFNTRDRWFIYDSKEKKELISNINVLKLDQTEAETLTGQKSISRAVKEIFNFGPKEILITHEGGIFLFTLKESFHFPWRNKSSIGRTGRGDTAFISYLGKRITENPENSLRFATALTSLKLENPGPFNLPLSQVGNLIKREY